jgi:hypothetical protein
MRRAAAFVLSLALLTLAAAPSFAGDREDVIQVVTDAYVDGIHNFSDPVAIRKGFHPEFEMLMLREGKLEKLPLATWIERIEAASQKTPPPTRESGKRSTEARFPTVDVAGTAAFCKVEILREGKQVFTDYLALYKFADGWKIVGKSFYRHP